MGRHESPPRLLVVDDEPSGREILNDILETQGYEITSASHGAEALELAAAFDPDLVLLDVMMPGMDGFEVCRRLRADPALADVAIVLITALDDRASRLRGIEAGADDFLSKPFDRIELRARVQMITRLNRHRHLMAERAQRQAAEAQAQAHLAAEQLKDQFIADMSHELRTPLAALSLLAGNLDMLYDQLSAERRREMIRKVRGHTRVLSELVENVLQLSRLGQHNRSDHTTTIDLAALLRGEAETQEPLAEQRSQQLQVIAAGKLLVRGVPDLLRQVIRNLISNAIKYTPPGGVIVCACAGGPAPPPAWPAPADLPSGSWAALQVRDTGIGVDAQALPRIFERFYRVHPQSTIPGTGLGLAIVREIVESHQGFICVDSIPGQGSAFAVYLPQHEDPETDDCTTDLDRR